MQQDMIDFSTVKIINSPDVRDWPITSAIAHLGLHPTELVLEHTKAGVWPPVPFEGATQEATLWIFLKLGVQWYGSGVERIRPGQTHKPEGPPSSYAANWYYDPRRWGLMTLVQPKPGDLVGFMVSAGDQRGANTFTVAERSAIVLVEFPSDAGADFPPFAIAAPVPAPDLTPAPAPPPVPPDEWARLLASIEKIADGFEGFVTAVSELAKQIDNIAANGVKVHL